MSWKSFAQTIGLVCLWAAAGPRAMGLCVSRIGLDPSSLLLTVLGQCICCGFPGCHCWSLDFFVLFVWDGLVGCGAGGCLVVCGAVGHLLCFLFVLFYLSPVMRKPVFSIFDKVRLKQVCSAKLTS